MRGWVVAWGLLVGCGAPPPEPPPTRPVRVSTTRATPSPAEQAAEAAARALAHEAAEEAEAEAQVEARRVAAKQAGPQVQILRGRGSGEASKEASSPRRGGGQHPFFAGARWLQGRADARGLEVVVFWETWCGYCRQHMPELEAVRRKVRGGVEVVGVTTLSHSDDATARRFLSGAGISWPIAVVPERTKAAARVDGVPYAVVVRDGDVLWRGHPGSLDEDMLRRWVKGS
ncbi:MAG: TlpA family protein disulfide reductase [Alphaproteobacteria bacterium]|nr:TlpA family protein disulfide reductase [Alphaproteobacteria bacterium]